MRIYANHQVQRTAGLERRIDNPTRIDQQIRLIRVINGIETPPRDSDAGLRNIWLLAPAYLDDATINRRPASSFE